MRSALRTGTSTTTIALPMLLLLTIGASPTTKPSLKVTDKEIIAGVSVKLEAIKTRNGTPCRRGIIREKEAGTIQIGIVGEEGHPILISLPGITLVPGALEGNGGTLKVMQTIFCNVVVAENEPVLFKKMVRDLMDAQQNNIDEVTRTYGDVQVRLDVMPRNNESYIDVNMSFMHKPE